MQRLNTARRLLFAMAALLPVGVSVSAQTPMTPPLAETAPAGSPVFRLNGELSTFGELYTISGHQRNRPSSSARISLRSTLTAWQSIAADFNVMLSTEGSSARQSINQIDFNPRWKWGEAHVGDFTLDYSPLTLSGISIRGGSIQLNPGNYRLAMVSGLTSRTVSDASDRRSYERALSAGRIGFGREDGSSIDLLVVTARDRLELLNTTTTATDTTSLETDSTQNPLAVTPQENLVASTAANVRLLDKRLQWKSEVSASAITRDRRSDELQVEGVPDFLADIFTPRVSSGVDYAYITDLSLTMRRVAMNAGYQYVGPGYVSLGLASLLPDKQVFSGGVQLRHARGLVKLDGSLQQDNLIGQKLATTTRTRLTGLGSYRLSRTWNMTAALILSGMANDAAVTTSKVDYRNWIARTSQTISFLRKQGFRSLTLDFNFQHANDPTPGRQSSKMLSSSGSLGTVVGLAEYMELSTQVGLTNTEAGGQAAALTQTYGVGMRTSMVQQRLMLSPTVTVVVQGFNTSIRSAVRSTYQFNPTLMLSGEIEATNLMGGATSSRYDELAARVTLARRF